MHLCSHFTFEGILRLDRLIEGPSLHSSQHPSLYHALPFPYTTHSLMILHISPGLKLMNKVTEPEALG